MVFMGPTAGLLNPTVAVAVFAIGASLTWALQATTAQRKRLAVALTVVVCAASVAVAAQDLVQTHLVGFFCEVCDQGGWLCLITWCWLF